MSSTHSHPAIEEYLRSLAKRSTRETEDFGPHTLEQSKAERARSASKISVGIGARRLACDLASPLEFTVSSSSLLSPTTFAALGKGPGWRTCSVDKCSVIRFWDCETDSLIPLVLDCDKSFTLSGAAVLCQVVCSDLHEKFCSVLIGERVLGALTMVGVLKLSFRPRYHSSASMGDVTWPESIQSSRANPLGQG